MATGGSDGLDLCSPMLVNGQELSLLSISSHRLTVPQPSRPSSPDFDLRLSLRMTLVIVRPG